MHFSSTSSCSVVEYKFLKTWVISMSGFNTSFEKVPNAMANRVPMNTWQSWLFILLNFASLESIIFFKLEHYPSDMLSPFTHSHDSLLLSIPRTNFAFGLTVWPLGPDCKCNSSLSHISAVSVLDLALSFIFPWTSITVLIMFQRSFSMCITSKLWRSNWCC